MQRILAIFMNNLGHMLSISIVNFNTGEYLLRCLRSLENLKNEVEFDIWGVDNASTDGSLQKAKQEYPSFKYIENKENFGFGKAQNIALYQIKTEYILLLNPDTELSAGALPTMLKFMSVQKTVGAASCKLILGNGELDWAAHRGFPTPVAAFRYYFLGDDSKYHMSGKSMEKAHEVDAISGSFFMTRKFVLEKTGYFDEEFFMYGEDLDLCYRIKEAGFKIMYIPQVSAVHHKGISSGLKKMTENLSTADLETRVRSLNAFYFAMKIFYKKHLEKKYPDYINKLVYLGIDLKWKMAKRKMNV